LFSSLFEGKMLTLIRCKNVDYESSRSEVFLDIQLNIEGKTTLIDALNEHIQTETLDGDNKYDAGTHSLQVGS
jgi:ubiquitin carboxyl-terminal hydrolase 7